jgi:hypothetical protein
MPARGYGPSRYGQFVTGRLDDDIDEIKEMLRELLDRDARR